MTLFSSIKKMEDLRSVGVMFSTGRDSICMLDLFMRYAPKSVSKIIFMYYVKNLSYNESIIKYYEKRYGIQIERYPHFDHYNMREQHRKGKKKIYKMRDSEVAIRDKFKLKCLAFGYRATESLQRRGQLALTDDGIDYKYNKLFPLHSWAPEHIRKYVAQRKLVLPSEYRFGMRDINTFKGDSLLYIYNNYPEDYEKIADTFPHVRGELIRAREGVGNET